MSSKKQGHHVCVAVPSCSLFGEQEAALQPFDRPRCPLHGPSNLRPSPACTCLARARQRQQRRGRAATVWFMRGYVACRKSACGMQASRGCGTSPRSSGAMCNTACRGYCVTERPAGPTSCCLAVLLSVQPCGMGLRRSAIYVLLLVRRVRSCCRPALCISAAEQRALLLQHTTGVIALCCHSRHRHCLLRSHCSPRARLHSISQVSLAAHAPRACRALPPARCSLPAAHAATLPHSWVLAARPRCRVCASSRPGC